MDRYLIHYGIAGQRWGVRRYQNTDGTLTPAGRERYDRTDEKRSNLVRTMSEGQHAHSVRSGSLPRSNVITRYSAAKNRAPSFSSHDERRAYDGYSLSGDAVLDAYSDVHSLTELTDEEKEALEKEKRAKKYLDQYASDQNVKIKKSNLIKNFIHDISERQVKRGMRMITDAMADFGELHARALAKYGIPRDTFTYGGSKPNWRTASGRVNIGGTKYSLDVVAGKEETRRKRRSGQ